MPKARIPEVLLLIISKKQTAVLKGGLDGTDGGGHCSCHLTWCRLLICRAVVMFPVCARNGKENADMCRCRTWLRFPRLERRGRFECVLNIYGVEYVRRTNSLFSLCFFCFLHVSDQRRRIAGRCRNLCEEWRCCSVEKEAEH